VHGGPDGAPSIPREGNIVNILIDINIEKYGEKKKNECKKFELEKYEGKKKNEYKKFGLCGAR